jgi:subtilase family serine protease
MLRIERGGPVAATIRRRGRGPIGAALMLLSLCVAAVPALGQGQPMATRHVRAAVADGTAAFVGALPATRSLRLNIALPLRHPAELAALLERLYDPQSAAYRQFLSVEEFTARFGPSAEDYDAVLRFAAANGLTVTGTAPNRLLVDVTGSVADVERAFHVTLGEYRHPTENRTFYAADREPQADLPVALWHVTGLDNLSLPHPASLRRAVAPAGGAVPAGVHGNTTGSGPSGYFIGSDMRAAYYGGSTLTGKGQAVGLFEFAGYNENDVTKYFTQVGQTLSVAVVGVSTDGSSLSCTGSCDDTEQVLDIEQAISMAPGMSQVRVYVSDTSDVAIFNRMATDNDAKALSCSWAWSPADPSSDDPIFQELAAQGQSLVVASGDSGAYTSRTSDLYPADDAYSTAVGGTILTTASAGGAWKSEVAWAESGGGIAKGVPIPSYQKLPGVINSANKGSTVYRNLPDVAAEGDTDNYICYDGTCGGGWGGTSFAAPRWAGYLALANQQAVANGLSTPGALNPIIYPIGLGSNYAAAFHDITSGTNGTYPAVKGYDLVTGWGSPHGSGLINLLAP